MDNNSASPAILRVPTPSHRSRYENRPVTDEMLHAAQRQLNGETLYRDDLSFPTERLTRRHASGKTRGPKRR